MNNDYRETAAGKRRFGYKLVYRLTFWLQNVLMKVGIAWHNPFSDECTQNFSCCTNRGKAWWRICIGAKRSIKEVAQGEQK